jgi:hypothetical protein
MSDNEARGIQGNRYFLGSGQPTQAHVVIVGWREDRPEFIRRGKVHWIIQARIRTHSALETTRRTINLPQQLNLKPALVQLNGTGWGERPGQFRNANETYSSNEVNEALGDTHEGTNLTDGL